MGYNISKMSSMDLEERFDAAFEEQVGKFNNITAFEAKMIRGIDSGSMAIDLLITGMADSPSMSDFIQGNVEGAEKVVIELGDGQNIEFKMIPLGCMILSANDYIVKYEMDKVYEV